MKFGKDFIWGVATASYQIEGAANEDGRGLTTWDTFAKKPGKVFNNDDGLRACNHYYLFKDDVKLLKDLGVQAYRFSIAWSRIFPNGKGEVNEKGIYFYAQLIDELLKNNIEPWVTLFHWDLPQALQDEYKGWLSKDVSKLFAEYVGTIGERFSDRVQNWFTINEIRCFTTYAHRDGKHAPGNILSEQLVNQTVHNALLGHGLAVQAIRANSKQIANIGLVDNLETTWPAIDTKENIEAAKLAFLDLNDNILVPLFTGKYQERYLNLLGKEAPDYTQEEMKIISEKIDFIGYNYYFGIPVRASKTSDVKLHGEKIKKDSGYEFLHFSSDFPRTDMGWCITPKALYYALKFTKELFGEMPIYITENGMAAVDKEEENGEVIDLSRIEFLRTHLEMVQKAKNENVSVKGYFLWSFMDNYEWSYGYSKRFGIYRVNYNTFERKLKYSGEYFKQVIRSG